MIIIIIIITNNRFLTTPLFIIFTSTFFSEVYLVTLGRIKKALSLQTPSRLLDSMAGVLNNPQGAVENRRTSSRRADTCKGTVRTSQALVNENTMRSQADRNNLWRTLDFSSALPFLR